MADRSCGISFQLSIFLRYLDSEILTKCISYANDRSDLRIGSQEPLSGSNRSWFPMIDLLLQLAYIALVLAVISLFVCTLPVWLIVLVVLLLR